MSEPVHDPNLPSPANNLPSPPPEHATVTFQGDTHDQGHQPLGNASLVGVPGHLMHLAKEIRELNEEDLLHISAVAQKYVNRDVYSLIEYSGEAWYLPSVRETEEDEKRWQIGWNLDKGLIISVAGRRIELKVLSWLVRAAILVWLWWTLWLILNPPRNIIEPGGWLWDPLVVFILSSLVGGTVCRLVQLPPLIGVIWFAIMWHNIPTLDYLTSGIDPKQLAIAQRIGLTTLMARAGFSISLPGLKKHLRTTLLMATIPYACELVVHSLISDRLYGTSDYQWSFFQGAVSTVMSPAVIVPGVLYLQDLGYGKDSIALNLLMSCISIEVCLGVWASNFIINLKFDDGSLPISWQIALGPLQIVAGLALGVPVGIGFHYFVQLLKREAKKLPTGKYSEEHMKSTLDLSFVVFYAVCASGIFFGYWYHYVGGASFFVATFAATVAHIWLKDEDKVYKEQKDHFSSWLAALWDYVVMSALFVAIGVQISLKDLFDGTFFSKALVLIAASLVVRPTMVFITLTKSGLPFKEKMLICFGALGKATVQASVGTTGYTLASAQYKSLGNPASYLPTLATAEQTKLMAALFILFFAPIGSIVLMKVGVRVLKRHEQVQKRNRK